MWPRLHGRRRRSSSSATGGSASPTAFPGVRGRRRTFLLTLYVVLVVLHLHAALAARGHASRPAAPALGQEPVAVLAQDDFGAGHRGAVGGDAVAVVVGGVGQLALVLAAVAGFARVGGARRGAVGVGGAEGGEHGELLADVVALVGFDEGEHFFAELDVLAEGGVELVVDAGGGRVAAGWGE